MALTLLRATGRKWNCSLLVWDSKKQSLKKVQLL